MSDLKLVADQRTPLERQLLDAAANESPSAEQRMRVRQALGLSAIAVAPPSITPAGRLASLGKVALVSLVAASAMLALLSGSNLGRKVPAQQAGAPVSVVAPAAPLRSVPAKPVAVVTAEPVASPLPPVEEVNPPASVSPVKASARSVSSVSKSSSAANSAGDLSEQLRLIDSARAAIAAGNASAASAALSSYSAKFPRGSFGQEAAVLRIEAVDLQGSHAHAASLARGFLAQHPNSPHVSLVQRIAARGQ